MKMYKDGIAADTDKDQIPQMVEAGWKFTPEEVEIPKDTEEVPSKKSIAKRDLGK